MTWRATTITASGSSPRCGAPIKAWRKVAPRLPKLLVLRRCPAAFAERAEHRPVIGGQQDTAPHRGEARIAQPGKVAR